MPGPVRKQMEASFGADFSSVRVHEGPQAATVGARAFTRGADIMFAPGQYDPSSQQGRALIGHELAHVVQQSEGRVAATTQYKGLDVNDDPSLEREADEQGERAARGEPARSGSVAIQPGDAPAQLKAAGGVVQLAPQTSHWGRFVDRAYAATTNGCHMTLDFEPGANVDATKIGLTQSIHRQSNGTSFAINPTAASRMAGSGPGEGRYLDRVATATNPIYGAPNLTGSQTLGDTAQTSAPTGSTPSPSNTNYELGHRFMNAGVADIKNAWLDDTPERAPSPSSSAEFETTALAISGAQAGTYYGSVRWGYQRDASGTLSIIPFTLVSQGVPSQNYLAAAGAWNGATARGNLVTRDNPTQCYRYASGAFTPDYTIAQNVQVSWNSGIGGGDHEYANVTIRGSGAHSGDTTYIRVTSLRDQGGAATTDVPVPDVYVVNTAGVELNKDVPGSWRDFDPLPAGTRVVRTPSNTRTIATPVATTLVWVEVVDGALTGHSGYVPTTALRDERP